MADILAEFEIPLLRGRTGAEYMMVNLSNRRSRNETFRESDIEEDNMKQVRYSDSFKFSWVYSPTNWLRVRTTRSLEQSICTDTERLSPTETQCNSRQNVVGQTGGLYGGGIFVNYSPTPVWSGNLFGTYRRGPLSFTAQPGSRVRPTVRCSG